MIEDPIFRPMAALIGLTFLVLLQVPIRRFRAGFAGKVTPDDFRYGEAPSVPKDVTIPNRNLMNLLEMPLLFYVACITLYVTKRVDATAVALAWAFVALRGLHSVIHLTYNQVRHRLVVYAASNVVLAVLRVRWFVR
jgi:hypothetical protein